MLTSKKGKQITKKKFVKHFLINANADKVLINCNKKNMIICMVLQFYFILLVFY